MSYATAVTGVERATFAFPDGSVALQDITLLAEPGELLAVIGPSGSGKSSLLRAIAGLLDLDSGRVLIAGEYTTGSPQDRDVAMVFEQTQLIAFLDVARNMSLGLDVRHVPSAEAHERVADRARRLRLTRLLARKPATLSRGEAARVGIGRALVRVPKAFLLDEPLAHLDAQERAGTRQQISAVIRETGVTALLVTHDPADALSIGDRAAVLDHGSVVQVAPPRELYDAPANVFVADFVSTVPIGLVPATLVVSGAMAGYQVGTRTLPTWLPAPDAVAGYRDRQVLLGLRAEDVYEDPRPEHGILTGVVATVEYVGPHAIVGMLVGEHRIHARFDRHTSVRPGSAVTVGIDAARAHVFDPISRRALANPPRG